MKIYTKTGNDGTTGLFGGERVRKDAVRIDSYGTIDELNATLGVAVALIDGDAMAKQTLIRLQNELFIVGGDLATPLEQTSAATLSVPRVTPDMTLRLEAEIDRYTEEVGPLTNFILPGGAPAGATVHQARCICRRAERIITHMTHEDEVNPHLLPYINRLSDHLFELARLINHRSGAPETIWSRETSKDQQTNA